MKYKIIQNIATKKFFLKFGRCKYGPFKTLEDTRIKLHELETTLPEVDSDGNIVRYIG